MYYQVYLLHLSDGSIIEAAEDYELPMEKGLIAKYRKAAPDELFTIGDALIGFSYVPKSSIVYISTGDVKKGFDVNKSWGKDEENNHS